jgi:hypothetical protein
MFTREECQRTMAADHSYPLARLSSAVVPRAPHEFLITARCRHLLASSNVKRSFTI